MQDALVAAAAGFAAGTMNALAGGGSFVTLPALIAIGLPSVNANASSTVALFPAGLASAWAYAKGGQPKVQPVPLGIAVPLSVVAGLFGSFLLLLTPTSVFDRILPWLLLIASLALAFGPRIQAKIQGKLKSGTGVLLIGQAVLSVYGGYFGGAMGIMTLAFWSLILSAELKDLQYPRTLLVATSNAAAVIAFAVAGAVSWWTVAFMTPGAILGGFGGALVGRNLKPAYVRVATVLLAFAVTAAFFVRAYR